ncbi:MAG: sodium:solute symporter [Phycisphaeraceae bacterium]|nr:sodium:solute symporter [Phycisphaeraceae bacterium]
MTTLAAFGVIDWTILAAYMAAMMGIGFILARRTSDETDFFLGSRQMPAWAVGMSVLASSLSAATFIGAPQESFDGNLTYLILNLGGILGALIVAAWFVPAFYHAGTLTIYGYLGQRIGPRAATAASVTFLVGRLMASGARLFMAGIAFSFILFGKTDFTAVAGAVVALSIVGTAYTALGGIRAVIWTDVVQLLVVIGAALLCIALLLRAIPLSIGEILHELRHFTVPDAGGAVSEVNKLKVVDWRFDLSLPYTVWGALAVTTLNVAAYGCDHDLAQRLLTTRSAWRGSASIIAAILAGIPIISLFMIIGLLLAIFYQRPDLMGDAFPHDVLIHSEKVYPQYLTNHLPVGLSGLAMAGLLAVAMGSYDSAVNAMAASWLADVRGDHSDRHSRGAVVMMGALLMVFGLLMLLLYDPQAQSLLHFALSVMTFAYTGLLGVFLTALLLPGRGSERSVITAMVVGALFVLATQPYVMKLVMDKPPSIAMPWTMLAGTVLSLLICAAGRSGNGYHRGHEHE